MRRVGWIRIGALGDLLVGLASLRETLDKWPEARITVVGSKLWLEILEPGFWDQIDRIAVVEKRGTHATIYEIQKSVGANEWVRTGTRQLRDEFANGYDAVFNTRVDSPRQAFPAFWARVGQRWGSAQGLARLIYNRRAPHDGKDPLIHERDVPLLLMDEAESGGTTQLKLSERIEKSPRIRKWRAAGLPNPRQVNRANPRLQVGADRYFVVNPTSSRREKAWPAKRFQELLRAIEKREIFPSIRPIVVGAPHETEWLREVAGDEFRVIQPGSIGGLFDVISGAEFLVTNTSSVQFVAAAVGTKTLTLMGRARPQIWGPLGPADRCLCGVEPKDIDSIFERELKAYESISVEQVIDELQKL